MQPAFYDVDMSDIGLGYLDVQAHTPEAAIEWAHERLLDKVSEDGPGEGQWGFSNTEVFVVPVYFDNNDEVHEGERIKYLASVGGYHKA